MNFRSLGFLPLPPMLMDNSIPDVELQERWVAGAAQTLRRLKAQRERLLEELGDIQASIDDAQQFYDDAAASLHKYRRRAALRVETKQG